MNKTIKEIIEQVSEIHMEYYKQKAIPKFDDYNKSEKEKALSELKSTLIQALPEKKDPIGCDSWTQGLKDGYNRAIDDIQKKVEGLFL